MRSSSVIRANTWAGLLDVYSPKISTGSSLPGQQWHGRTSDLQRRPEPTLAPRYSCLLALLLDQLNDSFQKSHSLLSDVLNSDINSFGSMTVSNKVKISSAGLSSLFPAINSPLSKWPYEHGPPRKHTLESVKTVTLILTQMEGSHQGC